MPSSRDVYIVSAARTPLGAFQGNLAHLSATDLGAVAIKAAIERASVPPTAVQEVYFGNVCSAGLGQAPARQAAVKAGLPTSADCTTVNKVCASGMKSVCFGAQAISLGQSDVVVAGGMESMSNIPFLCKSMRSGTRMGDASLADAMIADCLWDSFENVHMGECAGKNCDDFFISVHLSREGGVLFPLRSANAAGCWSTLL
jgi:acetyl-CoA C-acetyltransferase